MLHFPSLDRYPTPTRDIRWDHHGPRRAPDVDRLIDRASDLTGIPADSIRGDTRTRDIVRVRWAIAYVAKQRGISLFRSAPHLGYADHTSLVYGLRLTREALERGDDWTQLIAKLGE
jgi:chromosomal replication initiation ATPase DnaA